MNVLGGYFSHGPQAGELVFDSRATIPQGRGKRTRKSDAARAEQNGLTAAELGPIDTSGFLAFVWRLAGRPAAAGTGWSRERPLVCVLDNYSVHKSARVREEAVLLAAADVHLFYLPAYSPELSEIEPIWRDVKHRLLVVRSYDSIRALKHAVDDALTRKACMLRETAQSLRGYA